MAIRFPGVPDKDGILRIRCGDDVLEIEVAQPASAVSRGIRAPDDPDPTEGIVVGLRTTSGGVVLFPLTGGGKLDLDRLMSVLGQRFEDPTMADPRTVLLWGAEIDVHVMGELGRRLADAGRDVRLMVAFDPSAHELLARARQTFDESAGE